MTKKKKEKNRKIYNPNKRSKSYTRYIIMSAKEDSGIYKFPGQFLILGIILFLINLIVEHKLISLNLVILGIILFVTEAYFFFKR